MYIHHTKCTRAARECAPQCIPSNNIIPERSEGWFQLNYREYLCVRAKSADLADFLTGYFSRLLQALATKLSAGSVGAECFPGMDNSYPC